MLGKRKDINGDEFEYCTEHSSAATSGLEGFSWCELEDNPECHPERLACPAFVECMNRIVSEVDGKNYTQMIFPARLKNGVIVSEASEGHPDPSGLSDVRTYVQDYQNGVASGEPRPMFDNQNPDGTSRFECTRCIGKECNRCSWNNHCVCVPPCVAYTPEELASFELEDADDEEWYDD